MKSPVEVRIGSTGAGLFIGCGAGIGLVTPVALHSIPVLGQMAASLSASMASLDASTGGLGRAARGRVRGLGIRGLDAGFGCGVMLGYGWGAGVFATPTALQSLTAGAQAAAQKLVAWLPQPMQAALQEQQQLRQGQGQQGLGHEAVLGHSGWQDPALSSGKYLCRCQYAWRSCAPHCELLTENLRGCAVLCSAQPSNCLHGRCPAVQAPAWQRRNHSSSQRCRSNSRDSQAAATKQPAAGSGMVQRRKMQRWQS